MTNRRAQQEQTEAHRPNRVHTCRRPQKQFQESRKVQNSSRHAEESQNQFRESGRVQKPVINADSATWTSSELPDMNNMRQLQLPRRLRLLDSFTVWRLQLPKQLHCWTASLLTAFSKEMEWTKMHKLTTEWNASADIFNWNNLECKCKHFQMQTHDKHSKNQIQKMPKTNERHFTSLSLTPRLFNRRHSLNFKTQKADLP